MKSCKAVAPFLLKQIVWYWVPVIIWMGVVLWIGSSLAFPMQEGDHFRWFLRKGIHVGEYAVLAFLFCRALLSNGRRFSLRHALLAALFTVGFGGFDEWRQTFIPG